MVPSPSIQASDVLDSSLLSLSPTIRDNSVAVIVSSTSCLGGFGVDFFAGEESISGAVFGISSGPMVATHWVFYLIGGFQGQGTSKSFTLVLWKDLFPGTVALHFESHLWVFLLMQGDGVGHHLPLFLVL
ncbi:hypothetical protein NC651_026931 [Populus alba x Populus x berolinensis]|nr:hypothetical protein NC651_026931 [Populus alba x Populus x berolinensis]